MGGGRTSLFGFSKIRHLIRAGKRRPYFLLEPMLHFRVLRCLIYQIEHRVGLGVAPSDDEDNRVLNDLGNGEGDLSVIVFRLKEVAQDARLGRFAL